MVFQQRTCFERFSNLSYRETKEEKKEKKITRLSQLIMELKKIFLDIFQTISVKL